MASVTNVDVYKFLDQNNFWGFDFAEGLKRNEHELVKMLEEGLRTDVTLVAQGGSVEAHRSILASVSPVFRAMSQHSMKEQLTSTVDIPDMTIDGLQLFLLVLYTTFEFDTSGTSRAVQKPQLFCRAIDEHLSEFWEATHKYQVVRRRIRLTLAKSLSRNLTPDNCWYFYDHSLQDKHRGIDTVCHKYILGSFETVIASESFLEEMKRNPERVQGFKILAMNPAKREAALESFNNIKNIQSFRR